MIELVGVRINPITRLEFENWLNRALNQPKIKKIYKLNSEFLTRAHDNKDFCQILNQSDLNIVDGIGVRWAAKYMSLPSHRNPILRWLQLLGRLFYSLPAIILNPSWLKGPINETLPGVECFKSMLTVAEQSKVSIFIFGASQKNLELAINNLKQKFSNARIVGFQNGYDYDNETLIEAINKSQAKMLFVALGSPHQETWIDKNAKSLKTVRVVVGEGGTLDRIAHPDRLAPKWINRIGLEWLWRLFFNKSLTAGRGRWKRFWNSIPRFIAIIFKEKYRCG